MRACYKTFILMLLSTLSLKNSYAQFVTSVDNGASDSPVPEVVKSVFVGGKTYTAINMPSIPKPGAVANKIMILKNDTAIYTKQIISSSSAFAIADFIVDANGTIYLVGNTQTPFTPATGITELYGPYVMCISNAGVVAWAKNISGIVKATSVISISSTTLKIMGDNNGPVLINYSKLNGTRDANIDWQLASGTGKAGKLYIDGTDIYFTFTITGSVRFRANEGLVTSAGGEDAIAAKYDANLKVGQHYRHATASSEQFVDVAFAPNNVFFLGVSYPVNTPSPKRSFIVRRSGSANAPVYTTESIEGSFVEGKSMAYNSNESKLYVALQCAGNSVTADGTTIQTRGSGNADILVLGYTNTTAPTGLSYSNFVRLFSVQNTTVGSLLVTGSNSLKVYGGGDAELSAQDNLGTRVVMMPYTYNFFYGANISTASCPTIAAPSVINGPANVCAATATTYNVTPVAGATSYTWTKPTGWTGTSTSASITLTANSTAGSVTVKANNTCGSSSSVVSKSITIGGAPAIPTTINGAATVCPSKPQVYIVDTVSGATSYEWTLPTGWTGTSTTKSITATTGSAGGNITVKSKNACGTSAAKTLVVTTGGALPAQPGAMTGPTEVCRGSVYTYSVPPVAGATSYTWTLASGWVGSSTTNSIDITFSATSLIGSSSLVVSAVNSCGTGANRQILVNVINTLPAQPGTISSSHGNSLCPGTATTQNVATMAGVSSYQWSVGDPSYVLVQSGAAIVDLTIGNKTADISVAAVNVCGVGPLRTKTITVQSVPVPTISGVPSQMCVGSFTTTTLSATAAGGAIWEWVSSPNLGMTANINQYYGTATSIGDGVGVISVRAKGNCGYSDYAFAEFPVMEKPAAPSTIAGSATPTVNQSTAYSVTPVSGLTYRWSASGANINSTGLSTVTNAAASVNLLFSGPGSNTIFVYAENSCGLSNWSELSINVISDPAPSFASLLPANNATGVALGANLVLTFSEPVTKVAGKLVQLVKLNGDVVVGNYTTDSPEITVSGSTLTINPTFNLDPNTTYWVYMAAGAVKDAGNNNSAVISSSTVWRFTTTTVTGLEEETAHYGISVWPNPVQTELHIHGSDFVGAELHDLMGNKVAETNNPKLDVSILPSGTYLVKIKTIQGVSVKQIVKN
jgi:hypothetical protein